MKRFLRAVMLALVILAAASLCSCAPAGSMGRSGKPVVAVGIVPVETFVKEAAGEYFDVVTMVPPGGGPENYQPTSAQMQKLSDAALYFSVGVPAETANILPKLPGLNSGIRVVDMRIGVSAVYAPVYSTHSHGGEEAEEGEDHHIWLSPKRAVVMMRTIADELAALDEAHADEIRSNAQAYIEELEALDNEIAEMLSRLDNRSFILFHSAYAYFADDYGLNMIAIEENGKQAAAAGLQEVIDFAKENGITTVFYQQEFSENQAKAVAEEIGGTLVEVAPLSADYIESLRNVALGLLRADGK